MADDPAVQEAPEQRERWKLGRPSVSDERLPVGPLGWTLPRTFTARFDHSEEPLLLTLSCSFDGTRTQVDELTLRGRDGRPITPRDLSAIELARAVYWLTTMCVEPTDAQEATIRRYRYPMTPHELTLVAASYSLHYAAWGNPRQIIMASWGLPRATANRWIRKARAQHPDSMPSDGGDDDGKRDKAS